MEDISTDTRYSLSLTTPVTRDADAVFPGENWFLYWKTSSSLWKTKLEEFSKSDKVLVPVNWSFHSDTGDSYDFAESKPETDLKKLFDIACEIGKELIFLMPLTPVPFLANGGVPHLLARSIALNKEGMAYGIIDNEENINKLYSFYDPRVFQAYSKFCHRFGQYISKSGISSDVYGYICGNLENDEFVSYLDDSSKVFEQAFSRFLKARALKESNEFAGINSIEEEVIVKREFTETITSLYLESLSEGVGANWEGVLKFAFLGGSLEDLLSRMSANDLNSKYSNDISKCLSKGVIPSSILLPFRKKKGVLGRQLSEVVEATYLNQKISEDDIYESEGVQFRTLNIFNLVRFEEGSKIWSGLGLVESLNDEFYSCFSYLEKDSFHWKEGRNVLDQFFFVQGGELIESDFRTILKIFMNGGKVILDNSDLDAQLVRRLESFFLENNLEVEKVNFLTDVTYAQLGEGKLIVFNGEKLLSRGRGEKVNFWKKLIGTFEVQHISVEVSESVEVFWRTRSSSINELNYEEVRRLSIYNPTSYKKKVKFKFAKNFALLKIIDEYNCDLSTQPHEIQGELLPDGSFSIDFGVFS
ncbi:hypothetical protein BMS_2748 [Halobacteriovorax marinus SJ]|uniref:Glycoside hydrolase family 42 N-terminal domain-containing protein n=1 Tax=Halobacteriovorax marinus (strain ATCC BAA-682 / DSM 15412 / SJ) TaxID=862908 RepID=E1WXK6_HALMS|nr:hypothetical protein [Halobacteriovorax marinus]CBW27524.1 hypothetical protein BMS_2748 [Halobacteriovorax marinus SJ]